MSWAVEYRNLEMMNLLPRREVQPAALGAALHLAVLAMDVSMLDVLLQMGAKVSVTSPLPLGLEVGNGFGRLGAY